MVTKSRGAGVSSIAGALKVISSVTFSMTFTSSTCVSSMVRERRESSERLLRGGSLGASKFGSINALGAEVFEPSEKSDGLMRDSGSGSRVRDW